MKFYPEKTMRHKDSTVFSVRFCASQRRVWAATPTRLTKGTNELKAKFGPQVNLAQSHRTIHSYIGSISSFAGHPRDTYQLACDFDHGSYVEFLQVQNNRAAVNSTKLSYDTLPHLSISFTLIAVSC